MALDPCSRSDSLAEMGHRQHPLARSRRGEPVHCTSETFGERQGLSALTRVSVATGRRPRRPFTEPKPPPAVTDAQGGWRAPCGALWRRFPLPWAWWALGPWAGPCWSSCAWR